MKMNKVIHFTPTMKGGLLSPRSILRPSIFFFLLIFIFARCAPVIRTQYQKTCRFLVEPAEQSEQTKEGITISLAQIDEAEMQSNPVYTQAVKASPFEELSANFPVSPDNLKSKTTIINPFANKLAFKATIRNNTDHIIRMKDARVYFVAGNSMEDPVLAYSKESFLSDLGSHPDVKVHMQNMKTGAGAGSSEAIIAQSYMQALSNIVQQNNFKFINDLGIEILPKFKTSGFLAFPVSPEIARTGKISFFDITTKVDAAGNPVAKEQFDFEIKNEMHYWKITQGVKTEISKEEYMMSKNKN